MSISGEKTTCSEDISSDVTGSGSSTGGTSLDKEFVDASGERRSENKGFSQSIYYKGVGLVDAVVALALARLNGEDDSSSVSAAPPEDEVTKEKSIEVVLRLDSSRAISQAGALDDNVEGDLGLSLVKQQNKSRNVEPNYSRTHRTSNRGEGPDNKNGKKPVAARGRFAKSPTRGTRTSRPRSPSPRGRPVSRNRRYDQNLTEKAKENGTRGNRKASPSRLRSRAEPNQLRPTSLSSVTTDDGFPLVGETILFSTHNADTTSVLADPSSDFSGSSSTGNTTAAVVTPKTIPAEEEPLNLFSASLIAPDFWVPKSETTQVGSQGILGSHSLSALLMPASNDRGCKPTDCKTPEESGGTDDSEMDVVHRNKPLTGADFLSVPQLCVKPSEHVDAVHPHPVGRNQDGPERVEKRDGDNAGRKQNETARELPEDKRAHPQPNTKPDILDTVLERVEGLVCQTKETNLDQRFYPVVRDPADDDTKLDTLSVEIVGRQSKGDWDAAKQKSHVSSLKKSRRASEPLPGHGVQLNNRRKLFPRFRFRNHFAKKTN